MTVQSDSELLNEYAQRRAETAFAELVRRHVGMVYGTAVRMVADRHLAEDVTQAVFLALARNAPQLRRRTVISSWLHLTTRNLAAKTVRGEARRRAREQKIATVPNPTDEPESIWASLAPHLDEVLGELTEIERDALILRFFERQTARQIGRRLGLSEDAAQKRIERALERLRGMMHSRGQTLSTAALTEALLLPNIHTAAPALADTVLLRAVTAMPAHATKGLIALTEAHPVAAALTIFACLSLTTAGYMTGHKAAKRHQAAVVWREATAAPQPESLAGQPTLEASVTTSPPAAEQRPSVAEIVAEAAAYFSATETDPDAWSKGIVALSRLRPDEALQAIEQFERYRHDPSVLKGMGPCLVGLWARTDPARAIEYAHAQFHDSTLGIALDRICRSWAAEQPAAAWEWYRQATDQVPAAAKDTWKFLPKTIFAQWAAQDPRAAFDQFAQLRPLEEQTAINGISSAVKNHDYRAGILEGTAQLPDPAQRHRLAEEIADSWAEVDPESALAWAQTLESENPEDRLHVMSEALEQWAQLDPHAAAVWALTRAPSEFAKLLNPEAISRLRQLAGWD